MQKSIQHITRALAGIAALTTIIALPRPAEAIERYAPVPLTDQGRGSTARAAALLGSNEYYAVGSRRNADGKTSAMLWRVVADPSDPSGNTVSATELPKPSGWSAEATGLGYIEQDNLYKLYLCGNLLAPSGQNRAAIWTQNASGQFTNTILDDAACRANGLTVRKDPQGLISVFVIGVAQGTDGSWSACKWESQASSSSPYRRALLGGPGSEANAMGDTAGDGKIDAADYVAWRHIAGSALQPNDQRVATLMVGSDHAWGNYGLLTPPGAQSRALGITHTWDSDLFVVGEMVGSDGVKRAAIWIIDSSIPDTCLLASGPAPGYIGRSAHSVYAADGATALLGSEWSAQGARRSLIAFPGIGAANVPFFSPAGLLTIDVWEHAYMNAIGPGGAMAGEATNRTTGNTQAMLFIPTNQEVSQIIAILIGLVAEDADPSRLWKAEGRALRVGTSNGAGAIRAAIEFQSQPVHTAQGAQRLPVKLRVNSRFTPHKPNSLLSWTVIGQLYDPRSGQWVSVGEFPAGKAFSNVTLTIPDPERFAVAGNETLRARLQLKSSNASSSDGGIFEADMLEVETSWLP